MEVDIVKPGNMPPLEPEIECPACTGVAIYRDGDLCRGERNDCDYWYVHCKIRGCREMIKVSSQQAAVWGDSRYQTE